MGWQRSGQGGRLVVDALRQDGRLVVDALRQDGTQLVAGGAGVGDRGSHARWLDVGSTAAPARTSSTALRCTAGGPPV